MAAAVKRLRAAFYQTAEGNEPVRRWLKQLSQEDRRRIGEDIKTVEFGWPVGMPTCRSMRSGLYEVRTTLASRRIARVLFCIHEKHIVLLHGFIKKAQKTPQRDLDLALQRKHEVEQ